MTTVFNVVMTLVLIALDIKEGLRHRFLRTQSKKRVYVKEQKTPENTRKRAELKAAAKSDILAQMEKSVSEQRMNPGKQGNWRLIMSDDQIIEMGSVQAYTKRK